MFKSKMCKADILDGVVETKRIVTFIFSSLFENWSVSPNFSLRKARTFWHSIQTYLGLGGLELNTPYPNEQILEFFCKQTISIFVEVNNCWPMQFYFSIFVRIVEKKTQVFYKILYRCLGRNFLLKTPASSKECVFLSGICDNVRIAFSNSFAQKIFPETNQVANFDQFFTINEWTIIFGLIRICFPCGSSIGSLTERFKSSGYHGWVYSKLV